VRSILHISVPVVMTVCDSDPSRVDLRDALSAIGVHAIVEGYDSWDGALAHLLDGEYAAARVPRLVVAGGEIDQLLSFIVETRRASATPYVPIVALGGFSDEDAALLYRSGASSVVQDRPNLEERTETLAQVCGYWLRYNLCPQDQRESAGSFNGSEAC
jgi:hypothetical protein